MGIERFLATIARISIGLFVRTNYFLRILLDKVSHRIERNRKGKVAVYFREVRECNLRKVSLTLFKM